MTPEEFEQIKRGELPEGCELEIRELTVEELLEHAQETVALITEGWPLARYEEVAAMAYSLSTLAQVLHHVALARARDRQARNN